MAQAGFLGWTDRVGALITMATSLGAMAFAAGQLGQLNVMWLSIIGGALAGTSALMVRRSLRYPSAWPQASQRTFSKYTR